MFASLENFSYYGGGVELRPYQLAPVASLLKSISEGLGLTIVLEFSRQSGKDEFITHLILWLSLLYGDRDSGIILANPTYKPQTINAIGRLEKRAETNVLTHGKLKRRSDFIRRIGDCKMYFYSGDASANVVGATAYPLLIINEAQDISVLKYDKDFSPMCAANNATRLLAGTAWTSNTLLARERRAAEEAQRLDGIRRVFIYDADAVAKVHAPYGKFVRNEIARLGRQHPLIKTQYFCEEIDAQAGMFNAARRALMVGDRPPAPAPAAGAVYAFCIDVAGQDESLLDLEGMGNPGRDSTTLSVVDVDLSSLELMNAPTYRVVMRQSWQGRSHVDIFGMLKGLADAWRPEWIVMDATGVGEGLWGLLDRAFPGRVIPVKFTQQKKSELGWGFLGVIETGRFKDCDPNDDVRLQYGACISEILPGPARTMRWGVPDGTRGADGLLIHDDYILADALTAELDRLEWVLVTPTLTIPGKDPLAEMDRNF